LNLPCLQLDFLKALTDDTGIIQHSKFCIPNRKEGYCTDDNARALIVATKCYLTDQSREIKKIIDCYLSFLYYMQRKDGRLYNFMGYDRKIVEDVDSEECMGRTLWACGTCLNSSLDFSRRTLAKEIFDKAFPWSFRFKSLRAKALAILGLQQYFQAFPEDKNIVLNVKPLADYLMTWYGVASSDGWRWFEDSVTYANARLPHALFAACALTGDQKYFQVGVESLEFLLKVQLVEEKFVPVGSNGWYLRGGERAFYDQQPIEASSTIEALDEALKITKDTRYREIMGIAFEWFLGNNSKNVSVYDFETGACYDGITVEGLNLNQGAESTISYLLARLKMGEQKNSLH